MWAWIFLSLLVFCNCRRPIHLELEGPVLLQQPKPVTYFSNSFGLTLECLGRDHPPIKTVWLTSDGTPLPEISGIRETLKNNSLHLLPFRGEDYLASVHDTEYRCSVTNPVGTTLSPIFSVHAIIDEPFEIFITGATDESDIVEGSPALLNCDVNPSTYKEFIRTIHWKSIDQYGHETEIESDGKTYQISSGGSLLILTAKYQQLFICVAQNTLNKKIQSSSPFMVKSRAGVGGLPPKSVGKWQRMIFTEIGKNIDLLCLSVGNPSPNFRWEKFFKGKFVPVVSVESSGRIWGPLLSFDEVTSSQNGSYRCEVMNSFGSLSLDVDLIVSSVPNVELEPKKRTVGTGQNVELECKTPDVANHAEITWFHNGKSISERSSGNRMGISSRRLSILNIRYDEQGIYQCFLKIGNHHVGGTSNLVFQSSEPELIHTFISQTLQPSPPVSLKCSAIGNPIPIISWYVDGNLVFPLNNPSDIYEQGPWRESNHRYAAGNHLQLNEVVSHLNISNIRVQDSGEYQCIASNLLGSTSHSARLNIYGKLFMKEMGQMTQVAGEVALIPCLYGGYPVDKIVWRQNGSEIDTKKNKSRFRILANGTLHIDNIQPGTGQYTCMVSNRKGETASGTVSVNVLRPPVISSFSFDSNLQEGQRTSISCNVISGDLPIDITWLKDYQQIPQSLNITPMRVKFLSYLIFEELKGEHSGVYECRVSNAAATVSFSAQLSVKVPPTWLHEPLDSKALLKSDLVIPCQASGMPKPTIRWFRESTTMRTAIRPDHKFQISENGSLLILDVETRDASNYTCEGGNGVGPGIQKSIRVFVIIPAEVSAPMTSVVVAEGLPALLKCQIRGDRPIQVVWRKNSIVIEHSPRLVLQTVLDANSSVLSAELKIERGERSDSGLFVCMGSNQYGRDEDAISLLVKARPRPPQDLIVSEIGSRVIRLKWSLNTQNLSSDPVTHFVLQYKNSSAISWDSTTDFNNISVQAPANTAFVTALTPVTNYEIRILALNEIGRSLPSQPISVTTIAEAPSGPPLNVTAIPTSSRTILVAWEQPNTLLQNGAILGYHILVSQASISIGSNSSIVIDEKWGHQTEINELKPNSRYHISIRAYNVAGIGPKSPFISISTPEGAPDSPPLNVICEPLSPKSLQVLWEPPPYHLSNGLIQGYKVMYSPIHAELRGEKAEVKKTINRETTLHGLESYTNYSVRTLAYTSGGESSPSEPVFCTTEEDLPEEPADIKVLPSGPNSVMVSWLRPKYPNGVITKYRIAWKSEDPDGVKDRYYMASANEGQMLVEVRRLRENKRYTVWVTAATSLGLGKPSEMQDVVVTAKAPAKIASFPLTRRPKLDQSLQLPCRAVGYPLPEISWFRRPALNTLNNIMRNGSLLIPRVKDFDEGIYTCRIENSLGTDEIQHQIFISRPPSSVSVVLGYVTSNSIQIHWDPPSRADPPLTGYILQYRAGSAIEWTSKRISSRLSSFAMDNLLLCGTSYHIRLAAENSIGLGEPSPVLRTKTNGSPPEYPKLTEVIDGNGTMIRIDLSRWPDGGCSIKKFHLEFKNKAGFEWRPIPRNYSSRVFILNTTLGSKYDIRISLENEAGHISKTFSVESSPQFFMNYDKLMQNGEDRSVASESSVFNDPHIIVPIVSALICTTAVIICILIVVKRKTAPREGWKMDNSSSQQTWLSSEDFRVEKLTEKNKIEDLPGNSGGMSIYATLNSRKPIPMTIRDSTVRFQTFGQVENYDAPSIPQFYGKTRGNFKSSSSHEELTPQEAFATNHHKPRDSGDLSDFRNCRRVSNPNEYSVEDICQDYAHPYQVVSVNRGPLDAETYGRNTLRKQKQGKRTRGYTDHLD